MALLRVEAWGGREDMQTSRPQLIGRFSHVAKGARGAFRSEEADFVIAGSTAPS